MGIDQKHTANPTCSQTQAEAPKRPRLKRFEDRYSSSLQIPKISVTREYLHKTNTPPLASSASYIKFDYNIKKNKIKKKSNTAKSKPTLKETINPSLEILESSLPKFPEWQLASVRNLIQNLTSVNSHLLDPLNASPRQMNSSPAILEEWLQSQDQPQDVQLSPINMDEIRGFDYISNASNENEAQELQQVEEEMLAVQLFEPLPAPQFFFQCNSSLFKEMYKPTKIDGAVCDSLTVDEHKEMIPGFKLVG